MKKINVDVVKSFIKKHYEICEAFLYPENHRLKEEKRVLEAWGILLVKQCRFFDPERLSHEMPLTEKEQSIIRENRLKDAGARYCQSCGHIAGLRYKYKDGSVKGVTVQFCEVNGRRELRCGNCMPDLAKAGVK